MDTNAGDTIRNDNNSGKNSHSSFWAEVALSEVRAINKILYTERDTAHFPLSDRKLIQV